MGSNPRLLVVEDDVALSRQIAEYLRQHDFEVSVEHEGAQAKKRVLSEHPELVILDLGLPDADGLEVCRDVRPAYRGAVLILTARADDADQILGLESGADDFLVKPVRPPVLLARVRALLRRSSAPGPEDEGALHVGPLSIDLHSRNALMKGRRVELTDAEFELLWLLASNAGQTVSRGFLLERLCGTRYDPVERAIDLRVSRLRQKLGADKIKTVRGAGYLYVRN